MRKDVGLSAFFFFAFFALRMQTIGSLCRTAGTISDPGNRRFEFEEIAWHDRLTTQREFDWGTTVAGSQLQAA